MRIGIIESIPPLHDTKTINIGQAGNGVNADDGNHRNIAMSTAIAYFQKYAGSQIT